MLPWSAQSNSVSERHMQVQPGLHTAPASSVMVVQDHRIAQVPGLQTGMCGQEEKDDQQGGVVRRHCQKTKFCQQIFYATTTKWVCKNLHSVLLEATLCAAEHSRSHCFTRYKSTSSFQPHEREAPQS
jgi:hypothetical protein